MLIIRRSKLHYTASGIITPIGVMITEAYLLTAWCRVLLEKLTGLQLVKKFPAFHGTRRFITVLKSVRHLSLSWANPIQSTYPHPTSWRSILILSTHLRLGLPSGLFPSGFPNKTLYSPLSSPISATCHAHLILLDFITRTILGKGYRSLSSSLYSRIVLAPKEASFLQVFLNMNVLQGGVVSTSLNHQAGGPPLVGCPRLLIQSIRSYPPQSRLFLYPQPEDSPCRGDTDPLHMGKYPICWPYFKDLKLLR